MRILITGTAGFIGFHLANRLVQEGEEVLGLDVINDYYDPQLKFDRLAFAGIDQQSVEYGKKVQSNKYTNYRFIRLDLQDRQGMEDLFADESFDVVVNLAAQAGVRYSLQNPHSYVENNIMGFLNILEGCRHHKVGHLVYASSSSVYGLNSKMPLSTSENVDHPISLYAASKKSNELMAHTYSHLFGIPTTGLRFFTVYGPWGRPDMALFLFTEAILNNQPIKVFNHGEMIRDFTYVDDIVEGVVRVIRNPPAGDEAWNAFQPNPAKSNAPFQVYNIGNQDPVKLMDFIEAIEKKLNLKAEKIMLPIQPGDVPKTHADVADLVEDLEYRPSTSITEGVGHFLDWYYNYYQIENFTSKNELV